MDLQQLFAPAAAAQAAGNLVDAERLYRAALALEQKGNKKENKKGNWG